ncbi:SgcJ/EcaC family oxidoreductase [Lentzea sp. NPDC005914]|uniref:SgcJ/EcaC family oxidoreductase n=1 Tax=Lentzea sp. NPDC005914 TaxID=3154572 RepID=UPI0033EB1379
MNDEAGVRALFAKLADAWSRGDGAAYGECFTDDATYVAWVGTVYRGGEDIGRTHQVLFDTFLKDTKITTEAEPEVRFYGHDVAVLTTRGDVGKKAKTPTKVQTTTVVRQSGEWKIAAFHNTKRHGILERISFRFQPGIRPAGRS